MLTTTADDFKVLKTFMGWLLVTMVTYTILRLEFLAWNWQSWFHFIELRQISPVLWQGLRYDLSSILWLSSFVFLAVLLPWKNVSAHRKTKILQSIFLIIHLPFLMINVIDSEFIHFSGRRMTPDSFYLIRESQGKGLALIGTYWPLLLFCSALIGFYIYLIQQDIPLRLFKTESNPSPPFFSSVKKRLGLSFLLLVFFILGARGGFQKKPLNMAHAASLYADSRLTHLTLNSSFTTLQSLRKKGLTRLSFFENEEELKPLLNGATPGNKLMPWNRKPRHIVLFILESFGLEYTGIDLQSLPSTVKKKSYTPFLDSLASKSLYSLNSFANGRRSIEALPSLLAGVPSLLDEPFVMGPYQTNEIPRLGARLTEKGIWSGFFHGGDNGTMFFQEFIQRIGIEHYYGKNEYPHSGDDDGTWGIWDGPFLRFFQGKLNEIKKPFFAAFFSLSSHHPFKVPKEFEASLPDGPLPILKTIAYTDKMLESFFLEAEKQDWFSDTLFIFTADHTSKSYVTHYQTPLGNFRIPIIFYFPGAELTADSRLISQEEPVQQIDVFKTIEDIYELPPTKSLMGRSLLRTGPRKASLYLDGQQFLVTKTQSLLRSVDQKEEAASEASDPLLRREWEAHRQYYINHLLQNTME